MFNVFYIVYNFLIGRIQCGTTCKGLKRFGSQRKLRCANWFPCNFHILLFKLTNLILSQYVRRLKRFFYVPETRKFSSFHRVPVSKFHFSNPS